MPIDLYYMKGSPPCRAVQIVGALVGVDFNYKLINTTKKEQLTPEFLKMNPQHTLPTIVDNGLNLWESRAIMIYLVEKYGKGSSLYPNEPEKRAVINQRLMFDQGTLYESLSQFWVCLLKKTPITEEATKKVNDGLELLNSFLDGNKYVTGDELTLADVSLFVTVWCTDAAASANIRNFPNIAKWYDSLFETLPQKEENEEEHKLIKNWVDSMRSAL